ncbi:cytochrome c oxidase subunit 3 [candidate division KSB1 bacterium]|nr:cytochrome c oxidase subunit 3 [candidate division KSB1 bacterium]
MTSTAATAKVEFHEHHDYTGGKIGMWLFLFTELLLFGGMFIVYAVYRYQYPQEFHQAAMELNTLLGTINTIVLLTSSLSMALSIATLQRGKRKVSLAFLSFTIFCALVFLVNKYFEWSDKIHHGIYPNSEELLNFEKGEVLFFGLYYMMTGLHGIHVLAGAIILSIMAYFIAKRPSEKYYFYPEKLKDLQGSKLVIINQKGEEIWNGATINESVDQFSVNIKRPLTDKYIDKNNIGKLENSGLYWHLVDVIWIFLFPLFYLIT